MSSTVIFIVWLFALYWLARLYQGPVCVQCGARAKHRDDCPLRRDNE